MEEDRDVFLHFVGQEYGRKSLISPSKIEILLRDILDHVRVLPSQDIPPVHQAISLQRESECDLRLKSFGFVLPW